VNALYTAFVAPVLFPLHERLKGHSTVEVRRDLEKTQWWSHERLMALQLERLSALLTKARQYVPYYRDVLRTCGFEPCALRTLDDLRRLPFLTKPLIRSNLAQLKSEQANSLACFNTDGSSGEPLIFFIGKEPP